MSHYEKAWQGVLQRIDAAVRTAARPSGNVQLPAVSTTLLADAGRALRACGRRAFGESHVQEGRAGRAALARRADVQWHFIGPLHSANRGAAIAEGATQLRAGAATSGVRT